MNNVKLSVIIPSYGDQYLQSTINSLLENSELKEGELEIIAVLDGVWPTVPLKDDKRVRIIHLGANRGMRGAINAGITISRGEYIARFDEHIMVCKSWDKILLETFE
jgi:glycosyltransferase involved in cell wall biosynthesis